jgi:hypothetical protein
MQPATADTYIAQAAPTTNYGANTVLRVWPNDGASSLRHALLTFDFHALIPVGATITLATLSLYSIGSTQLGRTITCYRLLRASWVGSEATWNIYKTGSNWGTAGALNSTTDYTATDAANSASVETLHWQNWDVKAQAQYARDSVAGVVHFFIRDSGANADVQQAWNSSDYTADTSLCPKLYIEYTVPSVTGAAFLLRMI